MAQFGTRVGVGVKEIRPKAELADGVRYKRVRMAGEGEPESSGGTNPSLC